MFSDKLNKNLKELASLLTHTRHVLGLDSRLFLLNGPSGPSRDSMVGVHNGQGKNVSCCMKTVWPPMSLDIFSSCRQDVCLIY